jgi:hypothetical protein
MALVFDGPRSEADAGVCRLSIVSFASSFDIGLREILALEQERFSAGASR